MKLVFDNTGAAAGDANEPGAREMTRLERWRSNVKYWLIQQRRRLPYLVWWGEEVDVVVTFTQDRLPCGLPDAGLHLLFSGPLYEAEQHLRAMGVKFDTGMGFGGRDWEWDYSLEGPISVRFKRRAARPWQRRVRPKPQLVA